MSEERHNRLHKSHAIPDDMRVAAEPVLAIDSGGIIWDCTPDACTLFDYNRDALTTRHISLLLPQWRRRPSKGVLGLRLADCTDHTFEATRRDGDRFATKIRIDCRGDFWLVWLQPVVCPLLRHMYPASLPRYGHRVAGLPPPTMRI